VFQISLRIEGGLRGVLNCGKGSDGGFMGGVKGDCVHSLKT
jgi:hypothetical protein